MFKLSAIRIENYPKILSEHKKTSHLYYQKELDYTFNVSNTLSRQFYERHGAKVIEDAFELQKDTKGKKVMTTKHCLKYLFGVCPKNMQTGNPGFKEPFYLVYGGKKYRTSFDCKNCQMEIWNA